MLNLRHAISKICSRNLHLSAPLAGLKPPEPLIKAQGITKDRTQVIPVETSIKYLKSSAYKTTYGDDHVWIPYRRNHKGLHPPLKTRKTCIRGGEIATGSPCPICRDEYLVLDETNVQLLTQFICPHTGSILSYNKTGLCQKKQQELIIAVERARDKGLLTYDVPLKKYDYNKYIEFVQ